MTITLDDKKIASIFKEEFNSNTEKLKQFIENMLLNIKENQNFNYDFDEKHLQSFMSMSAENIEDWLDEKEDEIWK